MRHIFQRSLLATATFLVVFLQCTLIAKGACDPNEDCRVCLVKAFGRCITHGNDPICENRRAVCRVTLSIPLPPNRDPTSSPTNPCSINRDLPQCVTRPPTGGKQ